LLQATLGFTVPEEFLFMECNDKSYSIEKADGEVKDLWLENPVKKS
jgi:hypothetical protein